ncbi:MAG: hypothetical protein IJ033_04090 [Clostridia bacterium]|nr:hypothetical protein [Clostridia bacterium]
MKKVVFLLLVTFFVLLLACTLSACNNDCTHQNITDCVCDSCGVELHDFNDGCECTICGKTNHSVQNCRCSICNAIVHSLDNDCVCTICGNITHVLDNDCYCSGCGETYHLLNDAYCRHNDIVYYGKYPKTLVTDDLEKATLLDAYGASTPSVDTGWTSFGYYSSQVKSNYALYKDMDIMGEKYRAIYYTSYRPYVTKMMAEAQSSTIDEAGIELNTIYFYRFEPIKWKVLDEDDNGAILQCVDIIDSEAYQGMSKTDYDKIYGARSNWAQCWDTSTLRDFLNNKFYNTALNDAQKELVVDYSTTNDGITTIDKVTIPTEGMLNSFGLDASALKKQPTDYARAQGTYSMENEFSSKPNDTHWIVRDIKEYMSPGNYTCRCVNQYGAYQHLVAQGVQTSFGAYQQNSFEAIVGVSPMIKLNIGKYIPVDKNYKVKVNDSNGANIAGIDLKVVVNNQEQGVYTTDSNGEIAFVAKEKSNVSIEIIGEIEGYIYDKTHTFQANTYELEIKLYTERVFEVYCVDQKGTPIPNLEIKVGSTSSDLVNGTTDINGYFTFTKAFGADVVGTIVSYNSLTNQLTQTNQTFTFDENGIARVTVALNHPINGHNVGDSIGRYELSLVGPGGQEVGAQEVQTIGITTDRKVIIYAISYDSMTTEAIDTIVSTQTELSDEYIIIVANLNISNKEFLSLINSNTKEIIFGKDNESIIANTNPQASGAGYMIVTDKLGIILKVVNDISPSEIVANLD